MKLIGKHHVRANFYHLVSLLFVTSVILWSFDIIGDQLSFIISATLFIVDYIAEMYDPHPDAPGPWFKRHFHRAVDNSECGEDHVCVSEKLNGCVLGNYDEPE